MRLLEFFSPLLDLKVFLINKCCFLFKKQCKLDYMHLLVVCADQTLQNSLRRSRTVVRK